MTRAPGASYYGRGDFKGTIEEVQANVRKFGKPRVVTYKQGWFAGSLRGFDEPLLLIWLDVDLRQSVIDVLSNVFSRLVNNGVIFSDGLIESLDFCGDRLNSARGEAGGIVDAFQQMGVSYKAMYTGYGNLGLIIPNLEAEDKFIYDAALVRELVAYSHFDGMRKLKRSVRAALAAFNLDRS